MGEAEPSSPYAVPLFRAVWLTSLVANFGVLIQGVGAAWLMTDLSGSAEMVALVQTATSLPIVALSLWAGAIADNIDRRRVIVVAQCVTFVAAAALALLTWRGETTPWSLIALTLLVSCGTALNGPAWQASVGDMVPRPLLPQAVALNSMGYNVARAFGPALGGAVVVAVGAAGAFVVNALSTLGLIVVMLRWRGARRASSLPRERIATAMMAGLRYVAMSPAIHRVAIRSALVGATAGALPALLPLVARERMHGGALVYGLLLGTFGFGAVAGALLSANLRRRLSVEGIARLSVAALASGTALAAIGDDFVVMVPAMLVAGLGWVVAFSSFTISIQIASPRWVVARSVATFQTMTFIGLALGSWLSGRSVGLIGLRATLLAAALGLVIVGLIGVLSPLPQANVDDLTPQDRWREPRTAVPIEYRSGPVVLTIEHRIRPADVARFLPAMYRRKRICTRDGARHWTLLRDLGDAELWIERYHFPTWLDYVRHNARRTLADDANDTEIRELRPDGYVPVVHRRIERQVGTWFTPV